MLATQTLPQSKPKMDGRHRRRRAARRTAARRTSSSRSSTDRHRRRRRPRDRVPRRRDRGALDGGPHDDLQHVDRGRRARRHRRARRDDVRVREGSAARAEGRRLGRRAGALAHAPHRRRRRVRHARSTIDAATLRPYVSWGTNPAQSTTIDGVVPDPGDNESARPGAPLHGPRAGHARSATSGPTPSSSARARTPGSRTCGSPPTSSAAGGSPTACARSSSPAASPSSSRPSRRASTRSSPTPASSGAARAARCVWG